MLLREVLAVTGCGSEYISKYSHPGGVVCLSLTSTYRLQNHHSWPLPGEGAEQLDAAEAARIFEGQLAGALLAEDGQLALSSLASNTLSTLMPKLETQGRVGQARCISAKTKKRGSCDTAACLGGRSNRSTLLS